MIPDPLNPDTVRIRWLAVGASDGKHLARWRAMLDAEELAQADRFVFDVDRATYTAAHALLRAMMSAATGLPTAAWRYARRPFGKPQLAAPCNGLRFSLSHTHGFVACAVAYEEIGLDVEASDRCMNFAVADRFFAAEEVRLLNATQPEQRIALFFRFWTLKEAFIKATGQGLQRPLDSFSFSIDPLRITFHPERDGNTSHDDPAAWQFFSHIAMPNRPLALAVLRSHVRPVKLDIGAALPEEVAPH